MARSGWRGFKSAYKTLIIPELRLWPFTQDCLKLRQWCALYERADWLEGDRHHVILLPMTPGNTNGSITMRPTTKPREYSLRLGLSTWPYISCRFPLTRRHCLPPDIVWSFVTPYLHFFPVLLTLRHLVPFTLD